MTETHGTPAPTSAAGGSLEDRLADRTRELDELTRQHAATVEIIDIIARSTSGLQPVLDAVVGAAVRHCGADDATLFLREGTESFGAAHEGPLPSGLGTRQQIQAGGLGLHIYRDGQTIHAPDTEALDPVDFAAVIAVARQRGVRALVAAPIRHAGEVIGYLLLRRREVGAFTARQIAMLETLATQAGVAVANAGVITELRESLERQTATSDILRIISSSPTDIRPVFDAVAVAARRLCGAPGVGMFLRDGTELVVVAFDGSPSAGPYGRRQALDRTSVTGRAIADGVTVHTPDILALDPAEFGVGHETARRHGDRAILAAPLLREGRAVGGIVLAKLDPVAFTPRQIELLESFAAQAVIALENTRLFTELRESLEQQTATAEVLQVINASPGDTTPVFETILQKAHALCAIAYGSLQLYDGEKFRAVATHSLPEPLVMRLREGYVPGPNTRQLVDGAAFAQSADIGLVDEPMAKAAAEGGLRTLLRVALRKDGRLLGQIVCARTEVRPFADREIALLQGFAAQAVIAMENARLMTETREALERQTATAGILQAISSSPTDAQPVFEAIAQSAFRLLNSWSVIVWRYDGERMRIVASHGGVPGTDAASVRAALGERRPEDLAYPGDAILKRVILQIADVEAAGVPEGVREVARARGWRANIAVPMLSDGAPIGIITVSRKVPGAFVEREIGLLQTFAAQAVIAIENVHLFTELRAALDRQTAMAEVLAAINANPGELAPVFDTILEKAHRLCGSAIGNLSLYDGTRLRRVAFRGMSGETSAMVAEPRSISDLQSRLVRGERFVHVADLDAADAPRTENLTALRDREGIRSFVLVPLRREGAFLGYISANWAEPRPNVASEVALLESFADQAVIAIENARLLREQREALERQTAMAEVLTVINASPGDLTPVFATILDKALSLSRSSFGALLRLDGEKFWLVAGRNIPPAVADVTLGGLTPEAGTLLHRLVLGDDVATLADIRDDEAYRAGARSRVLLADVGGARSQLMVALRKDGRLLGCFNIYRTEVRAFSEAEVTLVRSFADQAVIAMENARLITETREALEQQTATADILRVISQSPTDVQPVLEAVVRAAVRFCGAEDAVVALRDGEDHWIPGAHHGPFEWMTGQRQPLDGTTASRRAMREARSFQLPDIEVADPVVYATERRNARAFGYRAGLAAPMLREGVAIGAIGLRKREAGAVTPRQVQLLEFFAAQAVIAIENVRLFTGLRESLEQQTATAEILRVISQSPTDVRPVLTAIAKAALRFCGAPDAFVSLRDGDDWVPLAHEGVLTAVAVLRRKLSRGSAAGRCIMDGRSIEIADMAGVDGAEFPESVEVARLGGWRSALMAPMLRDGVAIGAIHLRRPEPGAFTPRQLQLLESFAAQAVIAIENVRLFTELDARNAELRESLEQQTATADILRVISSSPTDVGPVLKAVAAAALRFCGAADTVIALCDGDESVTVAHEGTLNSTIGLRRKLSRDSASGQCMMDSRPVEIADIGGADATAFPGTVELAHNNGWRALLIVPLLREGAAVGAIALRKPEPGRFTPRQRQLLETFAAHAVIAIENVRLFTELDASNAELRESLEQQTATAEILRVISQSPTDVQPVLSAVARAALRFCGAADAVVALLDGDEWVNVSHEGALNAIIPLRRKLNRDSASGRCMMDGRPVEIVDISGADAADFPESAELARLSGWRAALAAPMMRDGVAIGSIFLRRPAPGPFTPRQLQLLEAFAAQAVIAIENVRLFTELDARNTELRESLEQQTATADILRVISRSPTDVGPVLEAVVKAAVRFCGAEDAVVGLRDGEDHWIAAAHDGPFEWVTGQRQPLDGTTAMRRAMREARGFHIPNIEVADPVGFATAHQQSRAFGHRAALAAPMLRDGVAIGAIGLRKREAGAFTPRQIALLESFAAQAVIAIENVRLFTELGARNEELRESLEQQTATAEILRVISQSPTDVQPVLTAVAKAALRFCGAPDALISLRDGDDWLNVAHEGPLGAIVPLRRKLSRGSAAGRCIIEGRPFEIVDMDGADAADFPESVERARLGGWRAALAAPMLREGAAIGVIFLRKPEPGPFTPRQLQLLEAFAAQAVIAFENVRLFKELGARNEDLRESLEQQTATAEVLATINANPGELGPVFDAMLQKAMLLCGATVGELRTYDGQDFRQVASRGIPDAYNDHYRPRSVAYGPGTGPARILAGEPLVHIPDLIDTDAYRRRDPDRVALIELGGARASLIAPLLRGSEVAGLIMLLREQSGPFGDRQIALLQNFAAQAVIAIENARLVSEQREALERQTATAEVLQVINANPGDLKPVFETMLEKACKLCDADSGAFWNLRDGLVYAPVTRGFGSALVDFLSTPRRVDPETGMGRLMQGHSIAHIVDLAEGPAYRAGDRLHRLAVDEDGIRSLVAVPLRKDGVMLGAFGLTRHKVQAFTDKHIALVQSFAAQAVIAMENARLIDEIRTARDAAETSLGDLKIAQANLIQAEKMASLGQLTAGIAHEIKNPLNFVNNFATLSIDLLDELKEIAQPAIERLDENRRAELDETMGLLTGNLGKIAEHGKRADGIVKSMLSHSRSGKGDRTPSDINALVEEALNLAYHGARAQDKEFNISLERDYGPSGEPIDVVPQDLTRVFLNLFGNGFYAANKRRLAAKEVGFRPTLRVGTRDLGDVVEVKVRDNGIGIPPDSRDKLFQPFFTTKPTGEGTGLGLSISYDIVTQQHAGSIEVESEPNSFTEFTIRLPRRRRAASPGERP